MYVHTRSHVGAYLIDMGAYPLGMHARHRTLANDYNSEKWHLNVRRRRYSGGGTRETTKIACRRKRKYRVVLHATKIGVFWKTGNLN